MNIKTIMRSLLFILSGLPFFTSASALPQLITPPGEPMVLVDPRYHVWGAYDSSGQLIKSGVASTGKAWCKDTKAPCYTKPGTFRVYYMGDERCKSARFPIPTGGAPMPYCMYFNGNQALHGSYQVGRAHLSHGCVRTTVSDARWLRYNFVEQGTLVKVLPY